jgi:hypothetical protein
MKKVVFILALVALVIGSVYAGSVVAAPNKPPSTVPQMQSYQDVVTSHTNETVWRSTDWYTGPFATAHFSVTIYATGVTAPEYIGVGMHWGNTSHSWSISSYEEITTDGVYTYEFDAGVCSIDTHGISEGGSITLAYAVTITYVKQL